MKRFYVEYIDHNRGSDKTVWVYVNAYSVAQLREMYSEYDIIYINYKN